MISHFWQLLPLLLTLYSWQCAGAALGESPLTFQDSADNGNFDNFDPSNPVAGGSYYWKLGAMKYLISQIQSSQAKTDQQYSPRNTYPPLFHWYRQKGIYDSFVHLNFHGDFPLMATLRNGYKFPDDNAFVTIFVSHALLEVAELMKGKPFDFQIDQNSLADAIDALTSHRDKNANGTVPVYNFWNQSPVLVNGTDRVQYGAAPQNILIPLKDAGSGLEMIKRGLKQFNISKVDKVLNVAITVDSVFQKVFQIPPDSDDTGCSLALGMKLRQLSMQSTDFAYLKPAYDQWQRSNSDPQGQVFSRYFKQYAYRPFATKDYDASSIDPRTYVWIRGFLNSRPKDRRDKSFALITTWMQKISEVDKQISFQKMPFNLNNVDASVTANALFGWASLLLFDAPTYAPHFDKEMQQMFEDNVELLAWALENKSVEKYPTFTLLYYPSKFAFYWFVGRLGQLLAPSGGNALDDYPDLKGLFGKSAKRLSLALQQYATEEILQSAQCETLGVMSCYWDDFLGNADRVSGKPLALHEDRVFSTALATNALIDIWTVKESTNQLQFLSTAPARVISTIQRSVNWLFVKSWPYPKENAFFSGSIKNGATNPYYFPHNTFRLLNGEDLVRCDNFNSTAAFGLGRLGKMVAAMTGVVTVEEYERMLKDQKCFGQKVPVEQISQGLNCDGCTFPYWSSPALTNAMTLLAMAKSEAIDFS